jgi:hypothetical protein
LSTYYLVKFRPLASTSFGRQAACRFGLPLFIDGSCRREPDLQSRYPSICSICRGGLFAPHLQAGDTIVYLTVRRHFGTPRKHRRLAAILKVVKRCESHSDAARWYRARSLPLPSNCIVRGNPPERLAHTMGAPAACACGARTLAAWDSRYRQRARDWPVFLICRGWTEVRSPPIVDDRTARKILRSSKRVQQRLPLTLAPEELREFKTLAIG